MNEHIEYDSTEFQQEKHPALIALEKLRRKNADRQKVYRLRHGDEYREKSRKRMAERRKK